jgi:hypothetical protein
MAGGEELGSGQIPAVGIAGGEGEREGKHEGTSGYLLVVLERLEAAGVVLPTGGRAGGRRRTAAVGFRRAKEGRAGLGGCSGARGSCWCSRFGKEKSGGESSTATELMAASMEAASSVCARGGSGAPFYRQTERERGARQAELGFGVATGEMNETRR